MAEIRPQETSVESGSIAKVFPNAFKALRSGRDRANFPRWWGKNERGLVYIQCSALTFGTRLCPRYLVSPYSANLYAEVKQIGETDFVFTKVKGTRNIALFCSDKTTVLKEWVFSAQQGVKPKYYERNTRCPNEVCEDEMGCTPIPGLPHLVSGGPIAPKMVSIFGDCVDIPNLPTLED